jgi:glycosyltransferase involved in cell wall biosynthesis
MKVIFDCRNLHLYPVGKPGFTGGTEQMVHVLAKGLAAKHTYWPPTNHPTRADVVVMVHSLVGAGDYSGDALVLASNGVDPPGLVGNVAEMVAAFPVFSRKHGELLCKVNPTVKPERCVVTGLGVDLSEYAGRDERLRAPGRIWVGNDPARGLVHVLDVFDLVRARVPEATLHVTYDFAEQFARMRWAQNALAETLWECRRRLDSTPGVVLLGTVDRSRVVREQLEAQVHLWPSDPPNLGSQIHGISQAEAAAAGCALVLSDVEAFPEVFGGVAEILPTIGTFVPDPVGENGTRVSANDYADAVIELMENSDLWAKASRDSRALAEKHSWDAVVQRWLALVDQLAGVPAC